MQRFSHGKLDMEMPLGYVQQLPTTQQAAIVITILTTLGLLTAASCTVVAPAIEAVAPSLFAWSRTTWPILGATFVAAGVSHFTLEDAFVLMYPPRGAWGLWYLPGSPTFHVAWTGVAEILGGAGVLLGTLPPVAEALPWLQPTAALGLFALTFAVTPANIAMYTHNMPGPVPKVIPPAGHAARFVLQVFLLTTLWGIAHP